MHHYKPLNMPNSINETDFGMLPKSDTMVAYKDRIVLYDNLDRPLSSVFNDEIKAFITLLPKRIDFTVVVLCVEGEVEIACNLRTLKAGPGGLIVVVPGTIGESIRIAPETHMIVLAVPDQDYAPDNSFQNATYSQKNFTAPICLQLDDEVLKSGIESYRQLKHTILTMGDQLTDDLVKAYIMVLAGLAAVNLQKWMISNPEDKIPPKELLLKKFLSNVEEHYKEHRAVSYYAGLADMEPKYFAKVIYATSGKRPLEWIKEHVILDAKSMLKSREYTITQICDALHFGSQAHFNRYFKEATGMSPLQYVKNN